MNFKSIAEFNSAVPKIYCKLQFCDQIIDNAEIIKKEILAEFEYGCKGPSPHIVILEPADNLNSDQVILEAANMYRADFNLQENRYLDTIADEAIFVKHNFSN